VALAGIAKAGGKPRQLTEGDSALIHQQDDHPHRHGFESRRADLGRQHRQSGGVLQRDWHLFCDPEGVIEAPVFKRTAELPLRIGRST
jgi:hypothetical protein